MIFPVVILVVVLFIVPVQVIIYFFLRQLEVNHLLEYVFLLQLVHFLPLRRQVVRFQLIHRYLQLLVYLKILQVLPFNLYMEV